MIGKAAMEAIGSGGSLGTLAKIALRNVRRHRARTVISASVMAFGILVFIFFDSMLKGMDRMTIDTMIDYSASSLKIRTPAYKADERALPLDKGIPEPDALADRVESLAGDSKATPRGRFVGIVSNYVDEYPMLVVAADPARDGTVFAYGDYLAAGTWLANGASNELVLGEGIATELGVGVGDSIVISAQTVWENRNADEFAVVGILRLPDPIITKSGAFVSRAAADRLLGTEGFATEIDVRLPKGSTLADTVAIADKTAATLRPSLPGLDLDPIAVLAKGYLAMRTMKSKASSIMIFIVLLIAGVGIANTILMSMYSRIREIGVLRAYGLSAREIKRLFSLEGLFIGFIGSSAGVALGCALNAILIKVGISIDALVKDMDMGEIPLAGVLRGEWDPGTIVFGFAFGVFMSWIAASIPARKAAKLEVTDALRFV